MNRTSPCRASAWWPTPAEPCGSLGSRTQSWWTSKAWPSSARDIPVRLDHNPRQGVGHTQRVAIENGQIIAEGLISRDTSWARDVAKSAVNGFPWQASIGAAVVDAEFVPSGQSVTVNGRTFSGPLHVVRQAILKEISFVDSGADPATSARIAAQHKEQAVMDDTTTVSTTNQNPAQTDEDRRRTRLAPLRMRASPPHKRIRPRSPRRRRLKHPRRRTPSMLRLCG